MQAQAPGYPNTSVLLVGPSSDSRGVLIKALGSSGIRCIEAPDVIAAWRRFNAERPDLLVASLHLPGRNALDLLTRVREVSDVPFIMQVPAGAFESALDAIRRGASDVIPVPFDSGLLTDRIRHAIAASRAPLAQGTVHTCFAGRSTAASRIREQITALSGLRIPVLIAGETGSGHDHVARCLASSGGILATHFLKVSPGERDRRTIGDNYKAVYLDSIELHSQVDQAYWTARILEAERGAATSPKRVYVSTTSDLLGLSRRGDFDPKLCELLLRFVVVLPSLRERLDDLAILANHMASDACRTTGRKNARFTVGALKLLQAQAWPGNVAQLAKTVERLVAFAPDGLISRRAVAEVLVHSPANVVSMRQEATRRQRDELIEILDATGGNLAEAARRLKMSRGAVIYRAQKYGLLAKRVRTSA